MLGDEAGTGRYSLSDPIGLTRWRGSITVANGQRSIKIKIKPPGRTALPIPVGKLKVGHARATIELESDCINGEKFVFSMAGEVKLNDDGRLPVNFANFDVILFDNNSQPNHLDLIGNLSLNATGYLDVAGTVSIGAASGNITGGWSTLGDFSAQGAMELTPFTGIDLGTCLVGCTCE